MRTELRFLLAISLMILVLVGTNVVWPTAPPEVVEPADSAAMVEGQTPQGPATSPTSAPATDPTLEPDPGTGQPALEAAPAGATESPAQAGPVEAAESQVRVETPLYDFVFSTFGARLVEARLLRFQSGVEEGPVPL